MPAPILATKLFGPRPRPRAVPRLRLTARLEEGLHGKLTLISAPAGFGKTTLVSEWLAQSGRQAAWLSLDAGDGDPTRFLAYFVAALRTLVPHLGEGAQGALDSPQPPPIESLLTVLLNEIAALPENLILVLDDYHVVDSKAVDSACTFLLDHLPPQLHLVITSREDPQLPLPRLRARGHLTELRAADLRFTSSEAAGFLNQVMDLHLSEEEVNALELRTEGWIAALQLAALSMRGREDAGRVVTAIAGDIRYIVDYLFEEVLQRQPEPVRSFLLQTSILDRLSGLLCDAVTGQHDGALLLDVLERGNLFVVPLDSQRYWYRYHHLFAAVLAAHAQQQQPAQVLLLHRRASAWYAANGYPADATRHALAARDYELAADLIETTAPAMRRNRQETTLLGWLQSLPDELVRRRPVLCIYYAGTLLQGGVLEGVEDWLRAAERWPPAAAKVGEQPPSPSELVIVDQEQARRLPGSIAVYHSAISLLRGDLPRALQNAGRALDLLTEDDPLDRGAAASLMALAYWTLGDLGQANRMLAVGMANVQKAGYLSDAIGCSLSLADIQIAQGRLHDAMNTCERGLQIGAGHNRPVLRGAADMYVGMSALHYEHGDLHAAQECLLKSQELGEFSGLPQNPYRWRVAMARVRQAHGDLDGALGLLQEAERLYEGDFSPNVRPVAAFKTRLWIAQGRLEEAFDWARAQGLSTYDNLSYLHEFEYITLARVLLARRQTGRADRSVDEALDLLARLLDAAETGKRTGSLIEVLVVKALAHQTQGDASTALALVERALALAEPEGYVRTFVDEGPPMAHLLRQAAARGVTPDYAGRLLEAFSTEAQEGKVRPSYTHSRSAQALVEPLSQRELEVLRLFQSDLSGPEIARELVIALSTLRSHTKGIYGKLNVNSRRAAVKRASELDLI